MNIKFGIALASIGVITLGLRAATKLEDDRTYTTSFGVSKAELTSIGRNPFFVLVPGYQLSYEGKDAGAVETLTITVLDETKLVDGVETRIIEERESSDGQIVEISRNYFAISKRTNDVYYFGEDVNMYKSGKVVSHDGSWLAGVDGAKFGMMMPGTPLIGSRFAQELAPGKALDRSEIVSGSETATVPAGKFADVLEVQETSPLEPGVAEMKYYAAGVGLIREGKLKLVKYGQIVK